jgi:hypothetical protein
MGNAVREPVFDDLVVWIEKGIVPAGDDVLGDVSSLPGSARLLFHGSLVSINRRHSFSESCILRG